MNKNHTTNPSNFERTVLADAELGTVAVIEAIVAVQVETALVACLFDLLEVLGWCSVLVAACQASCKIFLRFVKALPTDALLQDGLQPVNGPNSHGQFHVSWC